MYGIKGIGIAVLLLVMAIPAFSAQDTSVLLEKAIYTEETLGKLNDAIAIYKQIMNMADMNREIAAMAIYRLGMCYRKLGSEADAFSTFSALARLYPEQRDLIAKSLFLNMKPAPWADGEVMRLRQKRIGTEYMGGASFGTYSVESGLDAGKPVWYLRYFIGSGRSPIYYSITAADAATMLPVNSRFRRNQTWLESRYTANQIEVINLQDGGQPARQIQSTGAAYDAWQLVAILRRLPLQPGFEAVVPVFESSSGSFANVRFQVSAREAITVPAGTYDCYKVVMISDDNLPNEQTFWITADSHAYVARAHIDRINEFELDSVEIVGKNQLATFEIPGAGIALSAPREWYLSTISGITSLSPSGAATNVGDAMHISAPDLDSEVSVTTFKISSERPYPAKTPDGISQTINGAEFKYQVRPDTRESVTVAGLTGERFIADTRDIQSADDIVQYTYRLSSPAKAYTFTFRTGKDNFDKMRSTFESIMSSVKAQ
jgi:hypothetical protein